MQIAILLKGFYSLLMLNITFTLNNKMRLVQMNFINEQALSI